MEPATNSNFPSSKASTIRKWIPHTYSPGARSRRKNNAIDDHKTPQSPILDTRTPSFSEASSKGLACPKCKKAFKDNWKLNDHLPTHSSEQPWQCENCPQRFKRPRDLKTHNNNVHCSGQPHTELPTQSARSRRPPKRSFNEVGVEGFVNETPFLYKQKHSSQEMNSREGKVNYLSNIGGTSADPIPQPHNFPSTIDGEEVPQVQIGQEVQDVLTRVLKVVESLPGPQGTTEDSCSAPQEVGDVTLDSGSGFSMQYNRLWNSGQSKTIYTESSCEDNMTSIDSNDVQQDEHYALGSVAPALKIAPHNQSAATSIGSLPSSSKVEPCHEIWADCEFAEPHHNLPPLFDEYWANDITGGTIFRAQSATKP